MAVSRFLQVFITIFSSPLFAMTVPGDDAASLPVPAEARTVSETSDVAVSPTGRIDTSASQGDSKRDGERHEKSVLLRYQFRNGDVLRYRMTQVGTMKADREEASERNVTHVDQLRRFDVRSVDDSGQARIVMRFERVEMSVARNNEEPVIFHSKMPLEDVPRLFQTSARRLRQQAPVFVALPTGRPVNEKGEEIGAEEDEIHLMTTLPEDAVAPGDSWKFYSVVKVRVTEEVQREIRLLTSYRMESFEDGIAKITFATSPALRLRSPAVRAQLIEATPKGYFLFDVEAGRLIKRVSRNDQSVYNAMGPNTVLTCSKETIEELQPEEDSVSRR